MKTKPSKIGPFEPGMAAPAAGRHGVQRHATLLAAVVLATAALAVPKLVAGETKADSAAEQASERVKRAVAEGIVFDPPVQDAKAESEARVAEAATVSRVGDDPVVMETFTVVESYQQRVLAEQIAASERRIAAEKFTWREGGTAWSNRVGPVRVKVGSWADGPLTALVKLEW